MDWNFKKRILNNLTAFIFLLPAAVVLIIFFFIPFFQTIYLSFFDYSNNIYSADFVGLKKSCVVITLGRQYVPKGIILYQSAINLK